MGKRHRQCSPVNLRRLQQLFTAHNAANNDPIRRSIILWILPLYPFLYPPRWKMGPKEAKMVFFVKNWENDSPLLSK